MNIYILGWCFALVPKKSNNKKWNLFMKKISFFIFTLLTISSAQNTAMFSGRAHPELKWETISTKHFNVHYHQGIEEIANKGAVLAEHYLPTLLAQMEVDTIPKIDIIFTTEDEIMNGFAMWTYQTFIWVDQNDASIWLEKGKWLEQVLAHELQHIVLLHKTKSWLPEPMGQIVSGLPSWVVEGIAEYETESWRPYRADLSHKTHVLKNKMDTMDPHHDGFSKILYWADRFGDSTIVQTLEYRNEFNVFNFGVGFKKATGISVSQFNEDWRRHMNTYYYGYRSQKETYKEIGEAVSFPLKKVQSAMFFKDSSQIAILGRLDKDRGDVSLIIAERDTSKERKRFAKWEKEIIKLKKKKKKTKKDSLAINKRYKEKILWDKNEVDYGQFHGHMSWSFNGKKLAYSKYHYGKNQSLVYDVKIYDRDLGKHSWLTNSERATYPTWIDSNKVAYVSHFNNVSNIFIRSLDKKEVRNLTSFTNNTQITFLAISPDRNQIAFAMNPENGNMDIYTINLKSKIITRLTDDSMADILPVWHPDAKSISYTSNANGVPNIYTINLDTKKIVANTDAGDGIWTHQWMPKDSVLLATTLGDIDTVRLIKVDPFRIPDTNPFSMRTNYTSWLEAGPDVSFVNKKPDTTPIISKPKKYKFTKHMRPLATVFIPIPTVPVFATAITDALGKNMFEVVGYLVPSDIDKSGLQVGYINPMWSLSISRNLDFALRRYQKAWLVDSKNGVSLTINNPINFGEYPSSNHLFYAGATIVNHNVTVGKETDKETGELIPLDQASFVDLPVPESGNDAFVTVGYQWLNRRPHKINTIAPKDGFGISGLIDYANKSLFGDFSFTRIESDVFANLPLNKDGSLVAYFRLKSMMVSGKPPAQEYVGLTDDKPIYLQGLAPSRVVPENHNPRGWSGYRLGDKLLFGTAEIRNAIGPISVNLISDFGNAWFSNSEKKKMIFTAGYELRFALGPIILSAGDAQEIEGWKDKQDPQRYYRLALTNPF